jgi:hypothetical protein
VRVTTRNVPAYPDLTVLPVDQLKEISGAPGSSNGPAGLTGRLFDVPAELVAHRREKLVGELRLAP